MQNVYALFLEAEEASVKHLKVVLFTRLLERYRSTKTSQSAFAKTLKISPPRACDLLKGHLEKFSLEMLHRFCLRLKLDGLS